MSYDSAEQTISGLTGLTFFGDVSAGSSGAAVSFSKGTQDLFTSLSGGRPYHSGSISDAAPILGSGGIDILPSLASATGVRIDHYTLQTVEHLAKYVGSQIESTQNHAANNSHFIYEVASHTDAVLVTMTTSLTSLSDVVAVHEGELATISASMSASLTSLSDAVAGFDTTDLETTQSRLSSTQSLLSTTQSRLSSTQSLLSTTQSRLSTTQTRLSSTQSLLSTTQSRLASTQTSILATITSFVSSITTLSATQVSHTTAVEAIDSTLSDVISSVTDIEDQISAGLDQFFGTTLAADALSKVTGDLSATTSGLFQILASKTGDEVFNQQTNYTKFRLNTIEHYLHVLSSKMGSLSDFFVEYDGSQDPIPPKHTISEIFSAGYAHGFLVHPSETSALATSVTLSSESISELDGGDKIGTNSGIISSMLGAFDYTIADATD